MIPSAARQGTAPVIDKLDSPRLELLNTIYSAPLNYTVDHPHVVVRKSPSTQAPRVAILSAGTQVRGRQQGRWLLLEGKECAGCWLLVDGIRLGFGRLLRLDHCSLKVLKVVSEAAVLSWDGIPASPVEYTIEWTTLDNPDSLRVAVARETLATARVHHLPADTCLRLRLSAKVMVPSRDAGEGEEGVEFATLVGCWQEVQTDRSIDDIETENMCCDPLSNQRGRCTDCDCHGFVLCESDGHKTCEKLEDILCRRCSCSCVRHEIVGEFHYAGSQGQTGRFQRRLRRPPRRVKADRAAFAAAAILDAQGSAEPRRWSLDDAGDEDRVKFVLRKIAEAQTLYETLGVLPSASESDLRTAYRRVSLLIHPDKVLNHPDPQLRAEAEAGFKALCSAFEALTCR